MDRIPRIGRDRQFGIRDSVFSDVNWGPRNDPGCGSSRMDDRAEFGRGVYAGEIRLHAGSWKPIHGFRPGQRGVSTAGGFIPAESPLYAQTVCGESKGFGGGNELAG